MKTGVSTTPWAVVRRPQRAAPSLATTSKVTRLTPASRAPLQQQTRVAVGVEAIARAHRVRVRLQDQLATRERRDQDEERRARQVEVRQERVHDTEAKARRDVDARVALERPHATVRLGRALERARRRGPHGEDPPSLDARPVHRVGDRRRNRHALRRQPVALDRRRPHGAEGPGTDGPRLVECLDGTIEDLMGKHGVPPLPPYIERFAAPTADDRERYQTVYAGPPGSVAAPTAGLHFTRAVLDRVRARGLEIHELTLHVGPGTFRPMRAATVEGHRLPPERVSIPPAVADAVNRARVEGRRVLAVGTTTTRALESAAQADGRVRPLEGDAGVYITPGFRFRVVDALLTNFHLPRSSLLVLVAAFAGRELILKAYAHAVPAGYRFYSYGDASLLL